MAQKVWDAYHQDSANAFLNKVTVLQLWAEHHHRQLTQAALDAVHPWAQGPQRLPVQPGL
jgi:hypothetical protein